MSTDERSSSNSSSNVLLDQTIEKCFATMRAVEPDVTVVVGGVEFQHYSTFLCCNSDYFDAMLSANMKEKAEKRIEFTNKDPEEWALFYSFIDPRTCSTAKLTCENVDMLLPWFHEFAMEERLVECDIFKSRRLEAYEATNFALFANSVVMSKLFDLPRTSMLADHLIFEATEASLSNERKWNKNTIKELTPAWVVKGELWDKFVSIHLFPNDWEGKTYEERLEISESSTFEHVVLAHYELMLARNEIQKLSVANSALEGKVNALTSKMDVQLGLECYIRSLHHGAFFGRRKVIPVHILKNICEINEGYLSAAGIAGPNWG